MRTCSSSRFPILDCYTVLIQTQDPVLRDVRVRTALALSIDTRALTKAITQGSGSPNNSPIPAASPFHGAAEARMRPVDVVRARELLAASGYRRPGPPVGDQQEGPADV